MPAVLLVVLLTTRIGYAVDDHYVRIVLVVIRQCQRTTWLISESIYYFLKLVPRGPRRGQRWETLPPLGPIRQFWDRGVPPVIAVTIQSEFWCSPNHVTGSILPPAFLLSNSPPESERHDGKASIPIAHLGDVG